MPATEIEVSENAVFLNIPYDEGFRALYLAYIAGLIHLNFEPRATLGISGGARRLDKIFQEIRTCRYSIHDHSRVQLDKSPPRVPRFNMPFELGLAVAWEQLEPGKHTWFAFEAAPYRVQKSLSDLNGTDPHIHGGTVSGVLRGLSNAFVRPQNQPTVREMMHTYRIVALKMPEMLAEIGAQSVFEARAFQVIVYMAKAIAEGAA